MVELCDRMTILGKRSVKWLAFNIAMPWRFNVAWEGVRDT